MSDVPYDIWNHSIIWDLSTAFHCMYDYAPMLLYLIPV